MTSTRTSQNPSRWLFIALVAAILVLALIPPAGSPTTGWDKSNHLLAFGTLALVGCRAWPGKWLPLLAGLVAYGMLIEGLQALTPYRSADWADVGADALGALAGISLYWLGRRLVGVTATQGGPASE